MSRPFRIGWFLGAMALLPCIVHAVDTDGDGMEDAWETSMGLNPADPLDAFKDKDGDRVPNLWEHDRGTDADDVGDVPPYDATVDSTQPADPTSPNYRFETLEDAYRSIAARFTNTYRAVVKVCRGRHDAVLTATDQFNIPAPRKIAWLGELGSDRASGHEGAILSEGDLTSGILLTDEAVLDGLIFESPFFNDPAISVIPASGPVEVRIVNCIIRNWSIWTDPMSGGVLGGALFNNGGDVWLVHSTISDSSAIDSSTFFCQGLVENAAGTIHVVNSVLWETSMAAATHAIAGTSPSTVQTSVIQGGAGWATNTNPVLTFGGYLTSGSNCIGTASNAGVAMDRNGEARPGSGAEIGADEWINTDADSLPDWWEQFWFGNLSQTNAGDPNANFVSNLDEYLEGTAPTNDQDGDGLTDSWEIGYFGNIAAQNASGNPDSDGRNNLQEQTDFTNPTQMDSDYDGDSDGLMDVWEIQHFGNITAQNGSGNPDGDGRTNLQEQAAGTDPNAIDSDWDGDADGLLDVWEIAYFGNTVLQNGSGNPDGDGRTNLQEQAAGTDPTHIDLDWDGDSDGLLDYWEIQYFGNISAQNGAGNPDLDAGTNLQEQAADTDPTVSQGDWDQDSWLDVDEWAWFGTYGESLETDFDNDGLRNGLEIAEGSSMTIADTNGDGISDGISYYLGLALTSNDSDGDNLTNAQELALGTLVFAKDSDGDGVQDDVDYFPLDPTQFAQPPPATGVTITLLSPPGTPL